MSDWLGSVIKRVRDDDAARPRSTQAAVGWSEVGGCRSALGYRLDGAWPSDDTDNWAAVRGTALHAYLEPLLAEDGVRTEVDTIYRGIPGHADLVGRDWLGDIKTKTMAASETWRRDPTTMRQARVQVMGYAAGLVDAGELPADATIRLLIVPADGSFADWWTHEEPFSRSLADEGADRLDEVRSRLAQGLPLPKDKPLQFCSRYCPFVSMCRPGADASAAEEITDPELASAIAAYGSAVAAESAAKKDKERYAPVIRGLRGTAGDWRISLGRPGDPKTALDEEWIRADYASRGERVPEIRRPGAAPRLSVTRVKATTPKETAA